MVIGADNVKADAELLRLLNLGAQRILAGDERPYDAGMALMGVLTAPMVNGAEFGGAAHTMWAELTDGIDGPPRYARGLSETEIEGLMRQAAAEWLILEPVPAELRRYFDRWRNWPESLEF